MNFQDYCTDVVNKLSEIKIVPVLVLNDLDSGLKMCELLSECGLPAAEITFRTTAAESIIREAAKRFPELYLGAGTILNTADLKRAFDAGIRRFRVTSLYGMEMLKNYTGITVTFSAPLPVANSQAVLMAKELGASRALAHIELDRESLIALRGKSVLELELYRLGRPALLVTRAELPVEGDVRDARSNEFTVRSDPRSNLCRVYPKKIHSIPRLPGFHDFFDLTMAHWRAEETDSFNFERELP